ncbi:MAG: hypothetical protein AAF086_06495, partial [Planctomycetota bacterium]
IEGRPSAAAAPPPPAPPVRSHPAAHVSPPAGQATAQSAVSPNPQLSLDDPAAVWRAVLDAVGQSNAAAWMDHFKLQSIDTSPSPAVAVVAPTMTFSGGAANVATGPRLQRVADTITQLVGRPVRAELAPAPARPGQDPAPGASGSRGSSAQPSPGTSARAGAASGSVSGGGGGGGVDRRDALNLPLVRDVFEIFPDASLIHTRRETPPPPEVTPPPESDA